MTDFTWDAGSMGSGVAEIDRQHQEILRWLENLMLAIKAGRGPDVLETMLDYLGMYADLHFACEEACMDAYACPAAAVNRAGHARFRANLSGLRERVRREGSTDKLLAEIEHDLAQWLRRHIRLVDTRLKAAVATAQEPAASGSAAGGPPALPPSC